MNKFILDTPMVKILQNKPEEIQLLIKMKDGKYAVQKPYEGDLRGLIGAMTLAIDVLAGKVILNGTVDLEDGEFKEPKVLSISDTRVLPDKRGSK